MKTIRLLMINIKQIFTPKIFIVSFCATIMLFIAVSGMYYTGGGIWYLLDKSLMGTGTALMFFLILPNLVYSASLSDDYESGVIKYYKIRSNIYSYTISKVVSSAISGFCTLLFSMIFFILILLPFNPYFTNQTSYYAYEQLMLNGEVLKGTIFYLLHLSLSGAIISSIATCISTFMPDKFVTISLPCVLYMLHGRITNNWVMDNFFRPAYMIEGIVNNENAYETILCKILLTAITVVIVCIISCFKMKGRVNNGEY